jgi:hypothetical protein
VPISLNGILPAKEQFPFKIKPAAAQKLLTRASGRATVAQQTNGREKAQKSQKIVECEAPTENRFWFQYG